ncbi:uncharacterized protein LOC135469314 isoform X1 [Liolophura sinensis]|uniref:uncharacterized protein LOC135469314 isoform X1 n=1 Tax=Liolophura sinensis TaxID=3198878 RepID=UPI00315812F2
MCDIKTLCMSLTFHLLFSAAGSDIPIRASRFADGLRSMRFLISVNDTWAGPGGCLATVATPPLTPGQKYNETLPIQIGDCDHGPMTFTVSKTFGQTSDLYVSGGAVCMKISANWKVLHFASSNTWSNTYFEPIYLGISSYCLIILFGIRTHAESNHSSVITVLVFQHVEVTFYSYVLQGASPPTCQIGWNGTYLLPTSDDPDHTLLPGCFLSESREGYHMTYFWFYILQWHVL